MGNLTDGVYCFFVHRSAKTAASDAETVTAQTDAARSKALDQLATANTESAQLRELNERFVRELRYAYETTSISRYIYVFNIQRTHNSRVNTLTQGLAQGDAKRGDRRQRRQRQGCGHRDADGRRQRPKRASGRPRYSHAYGRLAAISPLALLDRHTRKLPYKQRPPEQTIDSPQTPES